MKLSLLMGANRVSRDSKVFRNSVQCLEELYEIGYRSLDFPFDGITNPGYILRGDDWRQKVEQLANRAQQLGVTFDQCHLPFVHGPGFAEDKDFRQSGFRDYYDQCMARAIEAAAILGVKYATAHPLSDTDRLCDMNRQLEINHAYYDPFIELAVSRNVGIAYENMRISLPKFTWPYRYGCHVDDLIDLVDSYGDDRIGACWDTGHAQAQKQDQYLSILRLGHRLKNLHLNDCEFNKRDEHLLPFMGAVDWDGVVQALVEVDYRGVLNYEVGKVTTNCPLQLQKVMLESVYRNGLVLLDMYEKAKEERL